MQSLPVAIVKLLLSLLPIPLHIDDIIVYSGQLECCQWLVVNEANLIAKDNHERTPYDIAKVWLFCAGVISLLYFSSIGK